MNIRGADLSAGSILCKGSLCHSERSGESSLYHQSGFPVKLDFTLVNFGVEFITLTAELLRMTILTHSGSI